MSSLAVIIPVYNHARYIETTLDSVLAQTRKADHIFVIDDGSEDDSAEIVRTYADRGVDFVGQKNAGAHATLNRLVEKAAAAGADLIAILNSDDRFLPNRLKSCAAALAAHPEKSVACTGLKVIDDEGAALADDHPRTKWFRAAWSVGDRGGTTIPEWLGRANFIATTSNVVARTDYLQANPLRDYRFAHDYFFLAAAAIRDQIVLIPENHLEYRVHGSNTITTAPAPLVREMVRVHLDLYAELADEVSKDADRRARFTEYTRALWDNISAFHGGMFQVAAAKLISKSTREERQAAASDLDGPELDTFPNRQLVNTFDGTIGAGLPEKLDSALREKSEAKSAAKANGELAKLRAQLNGSRWVALGNLLGFSRRLAKNDGKSAEEKLEKLRVAVEKSGWLKLGAKLGSKASRKLRGEL